MTVYCYDTEFLDDGTTIDLISIGIVCEDGREYYAVNSDFDMKRLENNTWMMANVVPHLPLTRNGRRKINDWLKHPRNSYPQPSVPDDLDLTDVQVKPKWVIANEVREFLLAKPNNTGSGEWQPNSELWAYYSAYDHIALAQLWGPMMNLPKDIPMWTHDLMQLIENNPNIQLPTQSDEHDALADARWNMTVLKQLGKVQ